jgi:group I intron endonuclease
MYIYYVYAYLREKDNTPYYIGKGKDNRAYSKQHRIKPPKDKFKIVFYQTNIKEDDAFELERAYIKLFGRKDLGTGILRNVTDGGEGSSGSIHSEETKIKLSKIKKGIKKNKPAANKGKHHTEETKQKMRGRKVSNEIKELQSKLMKGRPGPNLGKSMSDSTKQKLREINQSRSRPKWVTDKMNKTRVENQIKQRWLITNALGGIEIIQNLRDYCNNHNLQELYMKKVAKGQYKTHKGYKCARIID